MGAAFPLTPALSPNEGEGEHGARWHNRATCNHVHYPRDSPLAPIGGEG